MPRENIDLRISAKCKKRPRSKMVQRHETSSVCRRQLASEGKSAPHKRSTARHRVTDIPVINNCGSVMEVWDCSLAEGLRVGPPRRNILQDRSQWKSGGAWPY